MEACEKRHRILCTREFQNSINESVYHTLKEQIINIGFLESNFEVQKNTIVSLTGSEFIFKGLRHNVDSIKSMEGITRVWVAEGRQSTTRLHWDKLIPTIQNRRFKGFLLTSIRIPLTTLFIECS